MISTGRILTALLAASSVSAFQPPQPFGTRRQQTRLAASSDDLQVMVNGMPGPMATAIAESCLRRGLTLCPTAITGPDIPAQTLEIIDSDTGKSAKVDLIPSSATEDISAMVSNTSLENLVAIDFTHPSAVNSNGDFYAKNGIPFVMGTTGGDRELLLENTADAKCFAVIAPNMAKQIVAMQAALEDLARKFPGAFEGYTLGVTESHQKTKADTSGTAKAVVDSLKTLSSNDKFTSDDDIIKLRTDEDSQNFGVKPDALTGHAFHTYTLTSGDGSVEFQLKHNVSGRRVYAEGTVDAAIFLAKKVKEGLTEDGRTVYNMIDVLEEGGM